MTSHYNLKFSFNDLLREVPDDRSEVIRYVRDQKEALNNIHDIFERVKIFGDLGSYLRIINQLEESEECLREALNLIQEYELGAKLRIANQIRLAHVYQWKQEFNNAEESFLKIIKECESETKLSSYLHFAYQHIGKLYFDWGEFEKALAYFKRTMSIRDEQGYTSLMESTRFAIEITKKKLSENGAGL